MGAFAAPEVSFRLKNNGRIGASFGHISNGNLSGNNPGTEVAKLFYQMLL
ncbi:MAG: acyloxyacyl hydrolase [Gammaproteobacteria bacterium]|nr:acyloxyacyl hydrolase [Gammaproteobacteria bacterium]